MKLHLISLFFLSFFLLSCSKENPSSSTSGTSPKISSTKLWRFGEGQVNGNLDFGEVPYASSKLMTLNIKNEGTNPIVSELSITGDFQIVYEKGCQNLQVGEVCVTKLFFSAINKNPGLYVGQITFGDYQGDLSAVVGTFDSSSNLSLKVNSFEINDTLDFGLLTYKESIIKTLVIRNNGGYPSSVDLALPSSFTSVFNSCDHKPLAPKTSCLIKMFFSGQGKDGLVNEPLILGEQQINIVAQVEGRESSVANNSHLVVLINNSPLEVSSVGDLGTINTGSSFIQTVFLKNTGSDETPILSLTVNDGVLLSNQCQNMKLSPNQSCRLMISLASNIKGVKQSSIVVNGYDTSKSFFIEYLVRSPGDTIDCSDGLPFVDTAFITWSGTSYSSCEVSTCLAEYHIEENQCIANQLSCQENGGSGIKTWNGTSFSDCILSSCLSPSDHIENNMCFNNVRSCSIAGAIATETWNGSSWGACTVQSCTSSSQHIENNSCVDNTRSCFIANGTGSQSWNGSSWGSCSLVSCNSPYYDRGDNLTCVTTARSIWGQGGFGLGQNGSTTLGSIRLTQQSDRHVVIYRSTAPIWASGITGSCNGTCRMDFQSDGNLVSRQDNPFILNFQSSTSGQSGLTFTFKDDCPYYLVVHNAQRKAIWTNRNIPTGYYPNQSCGVAP